MLGLVAVGSMASGPDPWSDHDFLVIAEPGATEALRTDPTWLPHHERLVLHFRETGHGVKAVYDDGHLVEFAVFAPDEIGLALMNRTRVLLDRADVTARVAAALRAPVRHRLRAPVGAAPLPGPAGPARRVGPARR